MKSVHIHKTIDTNVTYEPTTKIIQGKNIFAVQTFIQVPECEFCSGYLVLLIYLLVCLIRKVSLCL